MFECGGLIDVEHAINICVSHRSEDVREMARELLNETFGKVDDEHLGGRETVPETLEAFIEGLTFKQLKACYEECRFIVSQYRYGNNLDRVYDEWWYHLINLSQQAAIAIDNEVERRKAAKLAELE